MKKTVKSIIGILMVLMLAAGFVACGGGDGAKGDVIELRVLNYFSMANANAAEENEIVWDTFEKAHPNIKILREDEFNEPFHHKVEAYAASGQLPDVILCWPSGRSTTLHTQRLLKDLAPLVQRDGLASLYNAVSMDPSQQGAGYMGMITRGLTATNAFFINLEVLNDCGLQPAKTYAELKAQVPVLRAKGYETVLMANDQTWVMQSCLFSSLAGRFCGEGWEKRILSGQAKFTDPDFVAALQFVKTMYDDGVLSQATLATEYQDVAGLFATNKGAYMIDGDWKQGDLITDKTTGVALISPDRQKNIRIDVFPDIDGVKFNKSNTVVLATGWGMNANIPAGSPKEEAAWTLLKWLVGKEAQIFFTESGIFPTPSRTDIDPSTLNLEPIQQEMAMMGSKYNVSTVVIDAAFEGPVYTPLNDGLQAMGLGRQTPQQVAELTQAALEAWKATQ